MKHRAREPVLEQLLALRVNLDLLDHGDPAPFRRQVEPANAGTD
jgi:hypothetical protein